MGTNSNDAHNDLLEVEFPVSSPDSFTDFLDKNDDKIFEDFDFNNKEDGFNKDENTVVDGKELFNKLLDSSIKFHSKKYNPLFIRKITKKILKNNMNYQLKINYKKKDFKKILDEKIYFIHETENI